MEPTYTIKVEPSRRPAKSPLPLAISLDVRGMSEDVCSCAHNFNFLANNSNAALHQLFGIFTKLPVEPRMVVRAHSALEGHCVN